MRSLHFKPERVIAIVVLALVAALFWPGLHGGFLFDDSINITDNPWIRDASLSPSALWQAMWSSPSQELQRPLAMLSFAIGAGIHGLDPFGFKLVNLAIHLLNTALLALVGDRLLRAGARTLPRDLRIKLAWALALAWALLPINLTPVLYVVQRMESLAAVFVLLGLICYLRIRQDDRKVSAGWRSLGILTIFTAVGFAAKESAAVLPAFALLVELVLLRFRDGQGHRSAWLARSWAGVAIFAGLVAALVVYRFSTPMYWLIRDFDAVQRMLTESRVLTRYAFESLWPLPGLLGFYYDDMAVSTSLLHPIVTVVALLTHAVMIGLAFAFSRRRPLFALGIFWFYAAHAMTAGPLPLELAFEHRNYLASYGLLIAVAGLLSLRASNALPRRAVVAAAVWLVLVATTTHLRAREWSHPYSLAIANAAIAKGSSRAQYDLGMAHLVQSKVRDSERSRLAAMASFRRAAELPRASAAPFAAVVTVDARRGLAPTDATWQALMAKLRQGPISHIEIAVLQHLEQCATDPGCALTGQQVDQAYESALFSGRDSPALYIFYFNRLLKQGQEFPAGWRILRLCQSRHPYSAQCKREAASLEATKPSFPKA